MIRCSMNIRENCRRKCFLTKDKETQVKFNPGLSANRPSNNWALVSIGALHLKKLLRKLHFKSLKYNNTIQNYILKSYFENYTLKA